MNSIGRVEVIYKGALVGRLALSDKGQCVFGYDGNWLNSGFSISPFELPLKTGAFLGKPYTGFRALIIPIYSGCAMH